MKRWSVLVLAAVAASLLIVGSSAGTALGTVRQTVGGAELWDYNRALTFNTTAAGAGVSAAQQGFPVCVVVNAASWPSDAERGHFFSAANVGGKRVGFFDSDGVTRLVYEVEKYDAASQSAVYWVRVPTVDGNGNTDKIIVGYGGDPNGSDQDSRTAVWDSHYLGVWHFAGSGANSTSYTGIDFTPYGGATYNANSAVGGGYFLDGVDDYLRAGPSPVLNPTNITLFAVAKSLSYEQGSNGNLLNKGFTSHEEPYYQYTLNADGFTPSTRNWSSNFAVANTAAGVTMGRSETVHVPDSQAFTDVAMTYDGAQACMFEHGNLGSSPTTVTGSLSGYNTPVDIGRFTNLSGPLYFGSYEVAELRISDIARSAGWIKLEHASIHATSWPGDGWLTWAAEVHPDKIAPVTVSDATSTYANSATIRLSSTDSESGVSQTFYRLDGGGPVSGTTVVASALGSHTIEFWAVDNAGNTEAHHTVAFAVVDTVAPVTVCDARTTYSLAATVTMSATDSGSGVMSTSYRLDGGPTITGNVARGSGLGAHTFEYWAVDNAGNTEAHHVIAFTVVDDVAPLTVSDARATYSITGTITLTASDQGAGVLLTAYRLDAGEMVVGNTVPVGSPGSHSLEYWSVDNAGNTETHHLITYSVTGRTPTSVSIRRSTSSVRYPTPFVLSGVLTGGLAGDPCVVEVRKPSSARWSYSSARLAYSTYAVPANWWYRYSPKLRGTYSFRVRFDGDAMRLPCMSGIITVAVK